MCGLNNIGNTCWGNSLLQVFAKIPTLRVWLQQHETIAEDDRDHDEHCCLCYLAGDLRRLSNSVVNEPFAPRCMLNRVRWNADYAGGEQQDAHEACIALLQACDRVDQAVLTRLSDDVEELRTASAQCSTPFWYMFGGIQTTDTHCTVCSTKNQVFEVFSMLQLAMPDEERPSVESALSLYLRRGRLLFTGPIDHRDVCRFQLADQDGKLSPPCGAIGRRTTQNSVERWPSVLSFGIKRQKFQDKRTQKISKHLSFPLTLVADKGITYGLRGVVAHIGETFNVGHYEAYVYGLDRKWFACSDNIQPRQVTVDKVMSVQAYLLFYEKT